MRFALFPLGFLSLAGLLLAAAAVTPGEEQDPLAALGMSVTGGAAPGYVEDRACALCHRSIYDSYQQVGMARSFQRPRPEDSIEDFENNTFHHALSNRYYQMRWEGDRLVFRRYQLDGEGRAINAFERQVDWILGSGRTSRTYLFRTKSGELYQLPLAWYTQTSSWGMAPGYDRPLHIGLQRRVRRECMFCHNAYPDVSEGSDRPGQPHVFPAELPEGTGCQRCHGPGAEHARKALAKERIGAVRAAIVNPGRLAPERRDDICFECHMQPSVALPGVRRFGRGVYSFRPGQPLADYMVQLDVEEQGRERSERFEINHHPYRLLQSACYVQSGGKLNCLTCHDPHRKVPESDRAAHYREACLGCHQVEQCSRDRGHGVDGVASAGEADCAGCHMPRRRTQDVVQVVMTDHRIQRRPASEKERLAPLEERDHVLTGVEFLFPESAPVGDLGEIYRAAAVLEASGGDLSTAVARLEELLAASHPPHIEPYLELARGQVRQNRWEKARTTLGFILRKDPAQAAALGMLGIVEARAGNADESVQTLKKALEAEPLECRVRYNLGRILRAARRSREAVEQLTRSVDLCPNLGLAWLHLGGALRESGRIGEAIAALRKGLQAEPSQGRLYLALAEALLEKGERQEARRYLKHGIGNAHDPEKLEEALKNAQSIMD